MIYMLKTFKNFNFINLNNFHLFFFVGGSVFICLQPVIDWNFLIVYSVANLLFIYIANSIESNSRRSHEIFIQSIESLLNYSSRFNEDDILILEKLKEKYKEYDENGIDELDYNFVKRLGKMIV